MDNLPKKPGLFRSATVRLMFSYTAILMALSLLFSVVLYNVAAGEVNRALGPRRPGEVLIFTNDDTARNVRQRRIQEGADRMFVSLVVLNLVVLVSGSALSYFLARRTLEPIKEAHEAQARFTSDAAHELRTPLAVMQTETEVSLRGKKTEAGQYQKILKSNLEEVVRLRTLTDRLLMLAAQNDLPTETVFISQAVAESVEHNRAQAEKRGIAIKTGSTDERVVGNLEGVVNILDILLDNAIKYSPEKTRVTIDATSSERRVEVLVSDEGAGIPPGEHEKIFERFYRLDTSRSKQNVEGHGLGLSLARRLAEEMNGSLRVAKTASKGATFVLSLPKTDIK